MRRSVRCTAIPLAIVMALSACDNVSWEGLEVHLESPPEQDVDPTPRPDEEEAETGPPGPPAVGSLVHLVERDPDGDGARLLPVAEISPTDRELRPLPTAPDPAAFTESFAYHRFQEGEEFLLLAGGRRAGTFVADGAVEVAPGFCPTRFQGSGRTELVPAAAEHQRFLAIRKEDAAPVPFGDLPQAVPDAALEDASETAAGPLMMEHEAPWPPSMAGIRQALRVIGLAPTDDRLMAATFVFADDLAVGPADGNAYALFLMAHQEDGEGPFETVHSSYRRQDREGKAWPDPLDFFPWSAVAGSGAAVGSGAVLVSAFGAEERWFYALEPDGDGQWAMTFRDPCEPHVEE